MNRALLFYVIDERTDAVDYCKRKGMKPYEFTEIRCDNQIYRIPVQYTYKGHNYIVLNCDQCYSGYDTTLMRLPRLSYEELLKTAITSKKYQERIGAIGIILKENAIEFEKYLLSIKAGYFNDYKEEKQLKRMVKVINDFIWENTSYVGPLKKIHDLCEEIEYNCLK